MTFYHSLDDNFSLAAKILIVPVVSVGNVSQLAADLLIESLDLEQVGILDARDLVPVVGAREKGAGISTPLELYGKDGVEIAVIQQRSPVLKSRKESFSTSILDFIRDSKFASVLFLTGVDVSNRNDAQMHSPIYSFVSPRSPSVQNSPISNVAQVPQYSFASSLGDSAPPSGGIPSFAAPRDVQAKNLSIPLIPGGGLTRRLLSLVDSSQWNIPTAAILQFILEGDNRADAEFLANAVSRVLELNVSRWRQPPSWNVGLFGTPHDQTLYG